MQIKNVVRTNKPTEWKKVFHSSITPMYLILYAIRVRFGTEWELLFANSVHKHTRAHTLHESHRPKSDSEMESASKQSAPHTCRHAIHVRLYDAYYIRKQSKCVMHHHEAHHFMLTYAMQFRNASHRYNFCVSICVWWWYILVFIPTAPTHPPTHPHTIPIWNCLKHCQQICHRGDDAEAER